MSATTIKRFSQVLVRANGDPNVRFNWWNDLRDAGICLELFGSTWEKAAKTHTNFQTAGLTNDIELVSAPALTQIDGFAIKHSEAFAGTSITAYTISIGIAGELAKYVPAFDVFQAIGNQTGALVAAFSIENFGAAVSIRAAAIAVGANLDQSTAGKVDLFYKFSQLPALTT